MLAHYEESGLAPTRVTLAGLRTYIGHMNIEWTANFESVDLTV